MLPYLLSFRHTPVILSRMIAAIPIERHREPLGEDRFTLLEMAGHLADTEAIFSDRMRAAIERDLPEFERMDVGARAIEQRYAEGDMDEFLRTFAERRAETVAFLEGLSEAELDRELIQSFGRSSVRGFLAAFTGHDLYHLEQVSEYLSTQVTK